MYNLQIIRDYHEIMIISKTNKNTTDRTYDWADGIYRPGCDKCNKRNAVSVDNFFR